MRQELELQRKRQAIQRRMAELQSELDEQELKIKVLPYRERPVPAEPLSAQQAKE